MARATLLEEDFPSGWEDTCIIGSIQRNKNGSLTVSIQIDVSSNDGQYWQTNRNIRLERQKDNHDE